MEEKHKSHKKVPLGVIIIAIIYLLLSLGSIALSIISLVSPGLFQNIPGFSMDIENKPMFVSFSTMLVIFSILTLLIGIGLFRLWKWSRIAAITISSLFVFVQILSIKGFDLAGIMGIANLTFHLIIAVYLVSSKKTRNAFKKIKDYKEEKPISI